MQTVLKLNELPVQHCPGGVGEEKISVSVLVLLLPLSTMTARDQNRHLKIHTLVSSPQQSSWGRSLPGIVEIWVWRCLEAAPVVPGRWAGRNVGRTEDCTSWWESSELPNCELLGVTQDFYFTKLKLNWQTLGLGNGLHPSLIWYLLIAPVWSVRFSRAPFFYWSEQLCMLQGKKMLAPTDVWKLKFFLALELRKACVGRNECLLSS